MAESTADPAELPVYPHGIAPGFLESLFPTPLAIGGVNFQGVLNTYFR